MNLYKEIVKLQRTNHLGNVLATVSDRRLSEDNYSYTTWSSGTKYAYDAIRNTYYQDATSGTYQRTVASSDNRTDWYTADVVSYSDYFAFGAQMDGRFGGQHRYTFNGKETDGETEIQDYGMRIYNAALGKFLSVDPLTAEYPWNSTYSFAENDVIRCIDLDGAEKYYTYSGLYAGQVGASTEIRVLGCSDISLEMARMYVRMANKPSGNSNYLLNASNSLPQGLFNQLTDPGLMGPLSEALSKSKVLTNLAAQVKGNIGYSQPNPNYKGENTYTVDKTGDIFIDPNAPLYNQQMGLAWEFTNSINHERLYALSKNITNMTKESYVKAKFRIEAEACYNQYMVATEMGQTTFLTIAIAPFINQYEGGDITKEQMYEKIADWGYNNQADVRGAYEAEWNRANPQPIMSNPTNK